MLDRSSWCSCGAVYFLVRNHPFQQFAVRLLYTLYCIVGLFVMDLFSPLKYLSLNLNSNCHNLVKLVHKSCHL